METNATNASDSEPFDAFSQSARDKEIEDAAVRKILFLLSTQHYEVLFGAPYRGDDERVMDLIHHCEMTGNRIRESTDITTLRYVVSIIDTTLIQEMPPTELRMLCREILERDETLINHMPQLRARLVKLCRAIDMNNMFQTSVLSSIVKDVAAKNHWIKGHG